MTKNDLTALPIKITYVGEATRDDWGDKPWECDEWKVTISGNGQSRNTPGSASLPPHW